MSLSGKTALVTGAGSGIGFSIAETLLRFGARVIVVERDEKLAAGAQQRLETLGGDVQVEVADVTVKAQMTALAEQVAATGRLDILINNVGDHLNLIKPFLDSDEDEWDALFDINLKQILRMVHLFAPIMRDAGNGGSIVNISSIEGFRAIPTCATYGAMKTAISGFVRSMAIELAPYHIRINAVAPETTQTAQVDPRQFTKPEHLAQWDIWNPLGRWGQPDDTAGAVLFLASPLSSWVTGTTVHVDGGALAAGGWYRMPGEQQHWTLAPVIAESGFIF
ncbi:SDR family oxidoreductase [Halieaceae bacterium IMCC14734]|uniref:SDR family oxidoreductase n=2 Tax=Candidatus Litorirhabdus singularis TaxID=2518993 RepID=A0ABT3TFR4_9GAMM|nr:SDR family oxidoreductase [Candidatus Litorirhabdus singularis]